jgi:hypothetical protein
MINIYKLPNIFVCVVIPPCWCISCEICKLLSMTPPLLVACDRKRLSLLQDWIHLIIHARNTQHHSGLRPRTSNKVTRHNHTQLSTPVNTAIKARQRCIILMALRHTQFKRVVLWENNLANIEGCSIFWVRIAFPIPKRSVCLPQAPIIFGLCILNFRKSLTEMEMGRCGCRVYVGGGYNVANPHPPGRRINWAGVYGHAGYTTGRLQEFFLRDWGLPRYSRRPHLPTAFSVRDFWKFKNTPPKNNQSLWYWHMLVLGVGNATRAASGYFSRMKLSCSHMVVKTILYCTRECGCKAGWMSASCFLQPPCNGSTGQVPVLEHENLSRTVLGTPRACQRCPWKSWGEA